MNIARFTTVNLPMVTLQLNIRPVFDVNANVQGLDLASSAKDIEKTLTAERLPADCNSNAQRARGDIA